MTSLPPFSQLVRTYGDDVADTAEVCLTDALRSGDDPMAVIHYFGTLGLSVTCLDDLLAINEAQGEEELAAFRVAEGVAVSIASHRAWVLYRP